MRPVPSKIPDFYETDVSEDEVLERPSVACKRCYAVWKKKYASSK